MSKKRTNEKQLLNEGEVRKFFKLANIKSIGFLKERYGAEEDVEEDLPAEEEPMEEPEIPAEPMEEPKEEEVGEPQVKDLVAAIADAIQGVTGIEVEVEASAEGEVPEMPEEEEEVPEVPEVPEADEAGKEDELQQEAAKNLEVAEEKEEELEKVEESAKNPFEGAKDQKMKPLKKKAIAEIARRVALRLLEVEKK